MIIFNPKNTVQMYIFSCVICVFSGFVLRVCLEYKPENFTFKALLIRATITTCAGYISYIVYRDYKSKIPFSIELYLCLIGFFAVLLTSIFDKIGKIGLKAYSKIVLKRLLAYTENQGEETNV